MSFDELRHAVRPLPVKSNIVVTYASEVRDLLDAHDSNQFSADLLAKRVVELEEQLLEMDDKRAEAQRRYEAEKEYARNEFLRGYNQGYAVGKAVATPIYP